MGTEDHGEQRMERWHFLIQVESDHEASIIASILDSEGIPVHKKYQEAGEYLKIYMGMTNFGVEIYVPESMLEQAKFLVTATSDQEYLLEE